MYYRSLILSLSLLPVLGLGAPAISSVTGAIARQRSIQLPKRDGGLNSTKTLDTVNGFPDPVVHCSGRKLSDEGDTAYTADLDTAVTSTSTSGLYGSCDISGDTVDGDGALAWSSGTVQVYYCNHGFAATSCDVNEYWRADALITDSCGADGGGWVTISEMSITIGRDPTNSDGSFRSECGDGLHGVNENFVNLNITRVR
ncbi:hypothetical protein M406DRAFT_71647 [Cryphonectria parasitica EP155]|uniref:Cyanovirin-N domain-containing protein n=1 Tax=Cryphonectria parasitica (strain ATCC 38755 / EP155) TaxID=660469 RepID=A0A9P5CT11_CRYP1|nr:uncharacterized protein M406DRAFT_71647 [Cryphonectria parasitica EP155]KAF3768665.1 hypothetical protein M406DRAFT_71647 [Cryphonectria parasitica EP155]